ERTDVVLPKKAVKYGSRNKWRGESGYMHQIDVSVDGKTDVLLVECKYWARPVQVEDFLVFVARCVAVKPTLDGRELRGYFVTRTRFSSGGIDKLKRHYCIETAVVSSAEEFVVRYKDRIEAAFADSINNFRDELRVALAPSKKRGTRP